MSDRPDFANGNSDRREPAADADPSALRRLLGAALVISRAVDPVLERELAAVLDFENDERPHPEPRPVTHFAGLMTSLRMFVYAHSEAQLIDEFSSDAENIEVCIGRLIERLQSVQSDTPSLLSSH